MKKTVLMGLLLVSLTSMASAQDMAYNDSSAGTGMFIVFCIALALDFAVANQARKKGLDYYGTLCCAILFSPLLVGIWVAFKNPSTESLENFKISDGTHKKCPSCAELIKSEALKCRYCGEDVSKVAAASVLHSGNAIYSGESIFGSPAAPVATPPPLVICAKCKALRPGNAMSCPNCAATAVQ